MVRDPTRDPIPAQLLDLLESLRPGQPLPLARYQQVIDLIAWALVQVQDDQPWTRERIRHQRVTAVRDGVKRGLSRKEAYADAVTLLAGTPAACEWEMMKKVFLADEKARRRRSG